MERAVWLKRSAYACIAFGVVLLSVHLADPPARSSAPAATAPAPRPQGEEAPKPVTRLLVCDDAWQTETDHSHATIEKFEVALRENCFGGWIRIPSAWKRWETQHAPGVSGGWVSYWYDGWDSPKGPFGLDEPTPDWTVKYRLRAEGNGKVLFYCVQGCPTVNASAGQTPEESKDDVRPTPWIETLTFDPNRICNDAVDKGAALDRSEFDGDWFDVPLREGCYGPTVRMPKAWRTWRHQSADDGSGWISFSMLVRPALGTSLKKTKPAKLNETVDDQSGFDIGGSNHNHEFRLQGKGIVRFIKVT